MNRLLLLLFVGACADHSPQLPSGRYELISVAGHPLPSVLPGLTIHSGSLTLDTDSRYSEEIQVTWMGLPHGDTIRGDWFHRGDSIVLISRYGRDAGHTDGRLVRFQYVNEFVYRR